MKILRARMVRTFAGLVLGSAMAASISASPQPGFFVPPELVPTDSSQGWRAFGAYADFQTPTAGEFRLAVVSGSESAGFKRSFRLQASEGHAYVLSAAIKVDGDEQATARLWARIDDAGHKSLALVNQGNAPVRAGTGWQEASVSIYVPPGPFTLTLGGLASGRAQSGFVHLRLARRMPPSGAAISPEARSYVLEALAKVEQVSIFPPSQGWPQLRAWTLEQAAGARTPSDTYPALQLALQQLQDRHSSFNLPAPASEAAGVTRAGGDGQVAPAFGSESGVLSIPAFMDRRKGAFERFAADLREALEAKTRESQCGLVIDLRNNGGGNMWPMLVGISALFPDQVLGQFVTAEGAKSWSARDGIISLGDYPVLGSIAGAHLRDVPVAVLIGPHTASSGEAVAIALRSRPRTVLVGRPTADYVTANRVLELRDGAYIAVSASRMADPAGLIQEGPVEPTLRGTGGDDDLQIARNWLESQCAR